MPHPPAEPRSVAVPARVDRLDTVAARVVNRVQAGVEACRQCDADFAARAREIEDAMTALDRINEQRVALEHQKISLFAHSPSHAKVVVKRSGRDLAANVKKTNVVAGFVPLQKSLNKPQEKIHAANADSTPPVIEGKEDDVRPAAVHKRLGFAGLRKDLRPKKHKSRVKVESRKNKDLSKEGAKVLTTEERQQREADQISYVLNNMISGKRKLYGAMMRDAKSAFEAIDKDGSGSLDYSEFAAFLKRLGLGLREEQTVELATLMDADGSGEIDCDEFVAALEAADKRAREEAEIEKQKLDEENETVRRLVSGVKEKSCAQEERGQGQPVSEVERMRARILRTKRKQESYSYQLTGPHSLTRAAGFAEFIKPAEAATPPNAKMRVALPGTHGVTVAIHVPQPQPEPDLDGVDERIVSTGDNFTAAEITARVREDSFLASLSSGVSGVELFIMKNEI